MPAAPLSQQEIEDRLGDLPGWSLEGNRITCTYRLHSHFAALGLTAHVAAIQDELNHHSDLTLGYNTVSLSVNTHDAGDVVTENDLKLAARVAAIADGHGVR
ncbi:4a-hydroxytetrahydrobiopterin dehydratase [Streptomyces sp. NBC_01005]|uniref:4a-hydroxytetrahydrobiopterin dehydratase n=1 Tax=Streptomyces TaxID=1883 RepID=UPI00224F9C1C|nr:MULTISPECIES: 4a-hydroxytetrahydrobiopterin dehydratase [unclassified Streptomyces]MCX4863166.1 4a-hydroxytetrahydrobiopterin dehydratase [Streptomyces sp. NBC_00906]MCX4894403.1 4a-hydroxytetrahydrobiopterin dehydratase [Streptomyces sp. NBC_00892]WSW04211.1 4a-hydroxytetrahydrobiopterin dehydratase [Streptomyces sp. NBC_01005]WTC93716.1 4a-hydroxytetrahydrobiopterin dehydratase [Streptomyces sp. NBC_01650]